MKWHATVRHSLRFEMLGSETGHGDVGELKLVVSAETRVGRCFEVVPQSADQIVDREIQCIWSIYTIVFQIPPSPFVYRNNTLEKL